MSQIFHPKYKLKLIFHISKQLMHTFICNLYLDPVLMDKCTCLQGSSHMTRLNEVKCFIFFSINIKGFLDLARALQIIANPQILQMGYYIIYHNLHSFTSSRWQINTKVAIYIITQIRTLLRMGKDAIKDLLLLLLILEDNRYKLGLSGKTRTYGQPNYNTCNMYLLF